MLVEEMREKQVREDRSERFGTLYLWNSFDLFSLFIQASMPFQAEDTEGLTIPITVSKIKNPKANHHHLPT